MADFKLMQNANRTIARSTSDGDWLLNIQGREVRLAEIIRTLLDLQETLDSIKDAQTPSDS